MSVEGRPSVLIVDDDDGLAAVLALMLDRSGYAVRIATSGRAGLDQVSRERPDAVILDLMPDLDGLGLLRELRQQASTSDLPVIVLTARLDGRARAESQAAGANACLTKPVGRAQLVEQLALLLDGTALV